MKTRTKKTKKKSEVSYAALMRGAVRVKPTNGTILATILYGRDNTHTAFFSIRESFRKIGNRIKKAFPTAHKVTLTMPDGKFKRLKAPSMPEFTTSN